MTDVGPFRRLKRYDNARVEVKRSTLRDMNLCPDIHTDYRWISKVLQLSTCMLFISQPLPASS